MKKNVLLTFSLVLNFSFVIVGCAQADRNASIKDEAIKVEASPEQNASQIDKSLVPLYPGILKGTIGVIRGAVGDRAKAKMNLYDKSGKTWDEVSFVEELSIKHKVQPFAWHPDNFLLVYRCIGEDQLSYLVIANESTGEVKYIKKSDKNYKFETWKEHILDAFSVGFDKKSNLIRKAPSSTAASVTYDPDEYYHPVKIIGDWLQVKWGENESMNTGWVRWRFSNDDLLIEIFYFA